MILYYTLISHDDKCSLYPYLPQNDIQNLNRLADEVRAWSYSGKMNVYLKYDNVSNWEFGVARNIYNNERDTTGYCDILKSCQKVISLTPSEFAGLMLMYGYLRGTITPFKTK